MTRRDSLKFLGASASFGTLNKLAAAFIQGRIAAAPSFVPPASGRDWNVQRELPTSATLSSDGRLLATRTRPRSGEPPAAPNCDVICYWDVASRTVVKEFHGLLEGYSTGTFSPDVSRVCLVYPTRIVDPPEFNRGREAMMAGTLPARFEGHRQTIWDFTTGERVLDFPVDERHSPAAGAYTTEGSELFSLSPSYKLVIRRAKDGRIVLRADGGDLDGVASEVRGRAFSADARRIATLNHWVEREDFLHDFNGFVRAWDVERGIIRRYRGEPRIRPGVPPVATLVSVAITPDGSRIITGRFDHLLTVWDFETGEVVRTFRPDVEDYPQWLWVSPDGNRLVSADDKGTIRIWELETGRLLVTSCPEEETRVHSLAFLPGKVRVVNQGNFHNIFKPGTGTGPGTGEIMPDPKTGRFLKATPMTIRDIAWGQGG